MQHDGGNEGRNGQGQDGSGKGIIRSQLSVWLGKDCLLRRGQSARVRARGRVRLDAGRLLGTEPGRRRRSTRSGGVEELRHDVLLGHADDDQEGGDGDDDEDDWPHGSVEWIQGSERRAKKITCQCAFPSLHQLPVPLSMSKSDQTTSEHKPQLQSIRPPKQGRIIESRSCQKPPLPSAGTPYPLLPLLFSPEFPHPSPLVP